MFFRLVLKVRHLTTRVLERELALLEEEKVTFETARETCHFILFLFPLIIYFTFIMGNLVCCCERRRRGKKNKKNNPPASPPSFSVPPAGVDFEAGSLTESRSSSKQNSP